MNDQVLIKQEKERKNFVCTLCPRPKKYYAITYKVNHFIKVTGGLSV